MMVRCGRVVKARASAERAGSGPSRNWYLPFYCPRVYARRIRAGKYFLFFENVAMPNYRPSLSPALPDAVRLGSPLNGSSVIVRYTVEGCINAEIDTIDNTKEFNDFESSPGALEPPGCRALRPIG